MPTGRVIKKDDAARRGVAPHEPPAFEAERRRDALPEAQAVAADTADANTPSAAPPTARRRVLRGAEGYVAAAQPYAVAPPLPPPDAPSASTPPPEAPLPGEADDEKAEPQKNLETLKTEWDADWQKRLDAAVEAARAAGHADGYAQAQNELQADFEAQQKALAQDAAQLKTLWTEHIEASKPLLARLALDLAETILDAPLPSAVKGASERAITAAVEDLADDPPLTVRLHPVDHMRLQEAGVTEQLSAVHADLRWDPDPDLHEGDWSVSSPSGLIRRLREEIAQSLHRRLLSADGDAET